MKIVVHSKEERNILLRLLDFFNMKDQDLFLYFKDPLSFKIEEIYDALCNCDIEVDASEEPVFIK
ncbi:MAG: hypothetical protein ACTSQE_12755 [Candidatus Heimdallarchaeaceae archaeon]